MVLLVSVVLDLLTFGWHLQKLYEPVQYIYPLRITSCIPGNFSWKSCRAFFVYQLHHGFRKEALICFPIAVISILLQIAFFATLTIKKYTLSTFRIVLLTILSWIAFIAILSSVYFRSETLDFNQLCNQNIELPYTVDAKYYVASYQMLFTDISIAISFILTQFSLLLGYFQSQRGSLDLEPTPILHQDRDNNVKITVKPINNL